MILVVGVQTYVKAEKMKRLEKKGHMKSSNNFAMEGRRRRIELNCVYIQGERLDWPF